MKPSVKQNKRSSIFKTSAMGTPNYYVHADDDFREDWDWAKRKVNTSKAIPKPRS